MREAYKHEVVEEGLRIQAELRRREREIDHDRYAHWQPAEMLLRFERKQVAARMLHTLGVFPESDTKCMEVGYGTIGWLGDLISWGVKESSIYGIELDRSRAQKAKSLLPIAELQIGDASSLPWDEDSFGLVIISTVLSSILSEKVRRLVAQEIARVTVPGGAVLCYDLAINNPNNSKVLKVTSAELYSLFPGFRIRSKAVTLAPPLARLFAPLSWSLATWLQSVPFLRTHLLSVLIKQ